MRKFIAAVVVLLFFAGCSGSPTGPTLVDKGTVRFQSGDGGGFYAIFGDGGGHYDPIDLPDDMKVEGLRVHFVAHTVNVATTHMWGQTISIESIQRIE